MSCLSRWCFGISLILGVAGLEGADSGLRRSVRVYDYTGMSASTLAKAEKEASAVRILSAMGQNVCPRAAHRTMRRDSGPNPPLPQRSRSMR